MSKKITLFKVTMHDIIIANGEVRWMTETYKEWQEKLEKQL